MLSRCYTLCGPFCCDLCPGSCSAKLCAGGRAPHFVYVAAACVLKHGFLQEWKHEIRWHEQIPTDVQNKAQSFRNWWKTSLEMQPVGLDASQVWDSGLEFITAVTKRQGLSEKLRDDSGAEIKGMRDLYLLTLTVTMIEHLWVGVGMYIRRSFLIFLHRCAD